jgi:hypothetical protein
MVVRRAREPAVHHSRVPGARARAIAAPSVPFVQGSGCGEDPRCRPLRTAIQIQEDVMNAPSPDSGTAHGKAWPVLPHDEWGDTLATLHMWSQIVGKIRMEQTPWINHSWHVVLYVTPRGLTTSAVPHGRRSFQIDFDFLAHRLEIRTGEGHVRRLPLRPQSVADFHDELFGALEELGLEVSIHPVPNEVEDAIPFPEDREHDAYDPAHVRPLHEALVQSDRVFREFRARFIGKCSPVHFFWGSFDLAVTRFSGREAPEHPGGFPNLPDEVTREAYSHEVSSAGLFPGNPALPDPIFYSYAYPEPEGFDDAAVDVPGAEYSEDLGEWVLPYDAVQRSEDPDGALLGFLEQTYAAAADLADWDREGLERPPGYHPLGKDAPSY